MNSAEESIPLRNKFRLEIDFAEELIPAAVELISAVKLIPADELILTKKSIAVQELITPRSRLH
jgi:hypothetical protein